MKDDPVRGARAAVPILQTKLRRPQLTADLVDRDRLTAALDRALEVPLTLVSAPAGYGKSTLVSQWAERHGEPVAWLSLDERDSDPGVFLKYFLAALDTVEPGACPVTQSLLTAQDHPSVPVLAGHLVNELDALDGVCLIVLDDYYRIQRDSRVHELIKFLVEHAPRRLHLVLTSRRDPPLALHRLRAGGAMAEIRLEELRFSDAESLEFLQKTTRLDFGAQAMARLQHEVEGWAVGLRLVSLALPRTEDPNSFLMNLRGGVPETRDYLIKEVLAAQPPEVRDCMLKASVLDRFSANLLDTVCLDGESAIGSAELLDQLQARNLFVIPLDAQGRWFRYHHLFRELLQGQLAQHLEAREISVLHLKASAWLESEGLLTDAIQQALAAGEPARAAEVVERHRHDEFKSDRWYVVERWLSMLPADIRNARPGLLLIDAWVAYCRFQIPRIPALLEKAQALLEDRSEDAAWAGELAFFHGTFAYWEGDVERACERLESSLALLRGSAPFVEGEGELSLGLARCMAGDPSRGVEGLAERMRRGDLPEGLPLSRLLGGLIMVHLVCGELRRGRATLDSFEQIAARHKLQNTQAWASYFRACFHLQANELAQALHYFSIVAQQRYVFETRAYIDALSGLALTQQLLGQPDRADETVNRVDEFLREKEEPAFFELARSLRARLAVLRGVADGSVDWALSGEAQTPAPDDLFIWLAVPSITRARVLVAVGTEKSLEQASNLLEALRRDTERWQFTGQTIEVSVLQAVTRMKQGRIEAARAALRDSVTLARPGRWIRPFVELGQPMADLLRRLQRESGDDPFLERVTAAFDSPTPESHQALRPVKQPTSVDLLTNRELDVLDLLAQRLSNKEIATRLFVSTHTVKDHVKHIYQKLHVHKRRAAVDRAAELGLLTQR